MKKRAIFLIAGVLAFAGVELFNYTGDDIELSGEHKLESMVISRSLVKDYAERSIEDSLFITIHHTAGSKNQSVDDIAKFHVEKRGWPGVAYHIAVNEKGEVSLLNHLELRTYHDSGQNTISIGIVLVGNYEEYEPSEVMIEKLKLITDAICQSVPINGIRGHKDTSPTLCPGKYAHKELESIFF